MLFVLGERLNIQNSEIAGNQCAPSLMESELDAMVDLQQSAVFEEPFYIVILERTTMGTTVHMWRLVIASQPDNSGLYL